MVGVFAGTAVSAWLESPQEHAIRQLRLRGAVEQPESEISGLAWYRDELVVLPQYPNRYPAEGFDGSLFTAHRRAIDAFVDGHAPSVETQTLPIRMPGLADNEAFQGFEAIAFHNDRVYLCAEMDHDDKMSGLLLAGHVDRRAGHLELDVERRVELAPQTQVSNLAYEAILVEDDHVLVFYEANGAVNPYPHALKFDLELHPQGEIEMPSVEYRLNRRNSTRRRRTLLRYELSLSKMQVARRRMRTSSRVRRRTKSSDVNRRRAAR